MLTLTVFKTWSQPLSDVGHNRRPVMANFLKGSRPQAYIRPRLAMLRPSLALITMWSSYVIVGGMA
jgi:hypothetical protein